MEVSMDGLRKNLSRDCEALRSVCQEILNGMNYDTDEFIEAVNAVIRDSNVLNCIYNPDDKSFNDISDIKVDHIELESSYEN